MGLPQENILPAKSIVFLRVGQMQFVAHDFEDCGCPGANHPASGGSALMHLFDTLEG